MPTELEQQLDKLAYGEHLCPIHENMAESIASAAYFMKRGLTRGDRCLFIGDERCIEAIIPALRPAARTSLMSVSGGP